MADLSNQPPLPTRSHAASDALGLWEPKRTLTLEAARKHTQRIVFIRRALIAASVALVALLVFYFATQGSEVVIEDHPDTSVRMIAPTYSGRTSDALPFYLRSETATRELENRTEVSLVKPVLEFVRAEGAASSFVEADRGTYDDINKILDLRSDMSLEDMERENVVLETDDGYSCLTTHARIYPREKRIIGDDPIVCTGNFGEVSGNAYEITDNYRVFSFTDGMTGTINRDVDERGQVSASADAQATTGAPSRDAPIFGFDGDGPILVEADRATYQDGTTHLVGSVVVRQDDSTLYADEMTILRDEAPATATAANAGSIRLGAVREIIADGNFRYTSTDNDVTGDRGVYQRAASTMIVTGRVRVAQPDGNTVSTDRLVYDTVNETIRFSGQCQGRECGTGDRTRIVIRNE
ncbi:MAG: LPS export ABC transporter periplasmic protein LptC [Litorimonas sp.]